jgi:hypothetical protein
MSMHSLGYVLPSLMCFVIFLVVAYLLPSLQLGRARPGGSGGGAS